MKLGTRVFELYSGKYANLSELAHAMEIAVSQIYRVRRGERPINEKFIIGAIKAFPGKKFDELFYVIRNEHPEVMLTINDVARLLGVHINTVRRWTNKGILKAYRIGPRGDRRFRREDVDAFLRENTFLRGRKIA